MGKIAGILGILICLSCTPLMEEVNLQFLEPMPDGILTITVRDYENKIPENVSLHFMGKDSAVVTNTLGVKKIKQSADGRFYLALGRDILPTAKEPVYFSVRIEAPGYTPWVQELYYTSRQNADVFARLGRKSLAAANVFSSAFEMTGKQDLPWLKAEFSVKNGKGLNGYSGTGIPILRADYLGGNARGFVPVSTMPTLYTGSGGVVGYPAELSDFKAGVFLQVIENKSKAWWSWEGTSRFKVYLSPDALKPTPELPARPSKLIHYDTFTGRITYRGDFNWQKDKDGVYATFDANQAGYWFLGDLRKLCDEKVVFTLLTHYSDLDVAGLFQVVDAQTGKVVSSFYANLNLNQTLTVTHLPEDIKTFYLQFYDYLDNGAGNLSRPYYTSRTFTNCVNATQSVDLTAWKAPDAVVLKVDVVCPAGKTLDPAQIPAKMWAQFSESGKENWKDLVTFTRDTRIMKTYKLKQGETYDFRISTDGKATWPYRENNFKMKSLFWNYRVFADTACK